MLLAALLACTAPADDTGPKDPGAPAVRPWTVAIFMNGDNDLEEYVVHDLNELEAGDAGDAAHVVVQADRIEGYDTSDGDWTGARRYAIAPDDDDATVTSAVVQELGEVDMGDPAVLADFVAWADASYPSERLLLVLWDHGDGWLVTGRAPAAISYDDTTGTVIGVADGGLADALAERVAGVGPVELLGFDGCNMGAWEVAYAMRGQVDALSFSQSWVGWEGLDYTALLDRIGADPEQPTLALADGMAVDAVASGERTWSAVDVSAIDGVAGAVDALAAAIEAADDPVDTFQRLRSDTDTTDALYHDWYLDLGDLAAVAEQKPAIAAAAGPLAAAVEAAVVGAYGSERFDWTSGMTIFAATDGPTYVSAYATGPWAEATRWDELLVRVREAETGF